MVDFNVRPLRDVAASLEGDLESVVLLADREDFEAPYSLRCNIPRVGHELRGDGLQLLFARAATMAVAIVGTSHLRVVCEDDSTLAYLEKQFQENPALRLNMEQFGSLSLARAPAAATALRVLPFRSRSAARQEPHAEALEAQVFVGVDYGRSDIKVAVVDAGDRLLATYVTRWWQLQGEAVEYVDPQVLPSHKDHIRCLAEAAMAALRQVEGVAEKTVCGVGISAAGCVKYGKLCGIPPAMGGVEDGEATRKDLANLEGCVVEEMKGSFKVHAHCTTVLVNDGDASALYGAGAMPAGRAGVFLSCGTGLAGGVVYKGESCDGILELGKLVMGLRAGEGGVVPMHDGLNLEAAAQGMAGTQRAFFNLLAARGGELITGKAEQRAKLVAMQKDHMDEDARGLFESLGQWLARFVLELNEYLPVKVDYVEAGGKVTDGPTGEVMLEACRRALPEMEVRKAPDSEFGQAMAVASLVRPQ